MKPAKHNITIYQGEDYSMTFSVDVSGTPLDLSTYTVEAQIRKAQKRTSTLLADFTGTIAGNDATITLNDTATAAIKGGEWYYDVLLLNGTGPSQGDSYILYGAVNVIQTGTVK